MCLSEHIGRIMFFMPNPEVELPNPLLALGVKTFQDDFLLIGGENPLVYLQSLNVLYGYRPNTVGKLKNTFIDRGLIEHDDIGVVACGANFVSRIIENSGLPPEIMLAVEQQATIFGQEMLAVQQSAVFEKIVHRLARKAICTSYELLDLVDSFWKQYCDKDGDNHENLRFFRFGAGLSAEQFWRAVGSVLATDLDNITPEMFNPQN